MKIYSHEILETVSNNNLGFVTAIIDHVLCCIPFVQIEEDRKIIAQDNLPSRPALPLSWTYVSTSSGMPWAVYDLPDIQAIDAHPKSYGVNYNS